MLRGSETPRYKSYCRLDTTAYGIVGMNPPTRQNEQGVGGIVIDQALDRLMCWQFSQNLYTQVTITS